MLKALAFFLTLHCQPLNDGNVDGYCLLNQKGQAVYSIYHDKRLEAYALVSFLPESKRTIELVPQALVIDEDGIRVQKRVLSYAIPNTTLQ